MIMPDLFGNIEMQDRIVPAIPYMGGKRKLATKILNAVYKTVGWFDNLYDLFGGGGAVSVAGLLAGHKVYYNEFNKGVVNLMRYVMDGGELPTKWITREEFFKHKDGDDWYAGFIKCIWSFGNSQSSYLFGADIEPVKRLAHQIIIEKDEEARRELSIILKVDVPIFKTRDDYKRFISNLINNRIGDLQRLQQLERLEQLQRLQQLERLERLQQLQQLQRLQISGLSYEQVEIKPINSVVYCDPPYRSTESYQFFINYDNFYKWCLDKEYPVFISEYNMPSDFVLVGEFKHRSILSATANNEVIERVYWNGKKVNK